MSAYYNHDQLVELVGEDTAADYPDGAHVTFVSEVRPPILKIKMIEDFAEAVKSCQADAYAVDRRPPWARAGAKSANPRRR